MLDYRLDAETEALRKTVREFALEVVAPQIGEFYERDEFPTAIVRQMGELGLFGLPFPEEAGGMGGDYFTLCLALEELARVDSSVAITLEAGVSLGAMPLFRFGSQEQKAQWLPQLVTGERLGGFGLTEPGGGSDVPGGMRTTARLDGDHWVINGSKAFITNAGTAITSLVTVLAITDRKSTRLNSSHMSISYAVFCLKKKKSQLTVRNTQSVTIRQPLDRVCLSATIHQPVRTEPPAIVRIRLLAVRRCLRRQHDCCYL